MVKAVGVDPGTHSFDFFGFDDQSGDVIIDSTLLSSEIAEKPESLVDMLTSVGPVDFIAGPSGYGLPLVKLDEASDWDLFQTTLVRSEDLPKVPVLLGMQRAFRLLKKRKLPIWFIPGVIHLPTIPVHRKANRIDMGTADKLCCAVLAVKDQTEHFNLRYAETSFILAEVGYGYTAVLGVADGKIVDGIGGSMGGPGFLTLGSLDGELAYLLGGFEKTLLFRGGAASMTGRDSMTPQQLMRLAKEKDPLATQAWEALIESVVKGVAAMTVSVKKPREILLSGRLSRERRLRETLEERLSGFAPVRVVRRSAKVAKEAAEGGAILANGLAGGKFTELVDVMEIRDAKGSVIDHIFLREVEELKRRYGASRS
ncbi:MAG: DUF1464 family protein [Candidatus Bathyarchaeia archaeon]